MIKAEAVRRGLIPEIAVDPHTSYANFDSVAVAEKYLPKKLWKASDTEQFNHLNELIGGERTGYTWHHHQTPGKMQLVPTGIHNATYHIGGRYMWGGGTTAR